MSHYRILVIIDLQKEFADVDNGLKDYHKAIQFVKENGNKGFYDKIISTGFRNGENPNFRRNLKWYGCENSDMDSFEYLPYIDKLIHSIIFKDGYSDKSGCVVSAIQDFNNINFEDAEIDIIGCDLDACIMAMCFQLWDAGINFKVLTDYCYTTAKDFSKETVIKIMKRNFGECIVEDSFS